MLFDFNRVYMYNLEVVKLRVVSPHYSDPYFPWQEFQEHVQAPNLTTMASSKVGKVVHSALPARLLVDDTHDYILTDCEGGNPVSAPAVSGKVPLVTVDLG